MTYDDLVARLASYLVEDVTEANFVVALPAIIEQAELRCYRDIDFVATRAVATAVVGLVAGGSTISLPADFVVGEDIRLTPAGSTVRFRLLQRDPSFLADLWPDAAAWTGGVRPKYWAEEPVGTVIIAPTADAAYAVQVVYRKRPTPLSAVNPDTWLATHCPDLLFAAAMVAASGYTKNFGAKSDNPQQAVSWASTYETALVGARREEGRRKGESHFDNSPNPPPASDLPPQ
jgi:hypothetical protein